MKFNEVDGDLIKLALQGEFDVIAHGCNCFCTMGRGLAPQMAKAFGCDYFPLELVEEEVEDIGLVNTGNKGNINKLGQIDSFQGGVKKDRFYFGWDTKSRDIKRLTVVNAYTQYHWDTATKPLDYEALTLCLRKMNKVFTGKHIGLPEIGCHLAGGDWNIVKEIIKKELKDCDVTIVHYKP